MAGAPAVNMHHEDEATSDHKETRTLDHRSSQALWLGNKLRSNRGTFLGFERSKLHRCYGQGQEIKGYVSVIENNKIDQVFMIW